MVEQVLGAVMLFAGTCLTILVMAWPLFLAAFLYQAIKGRK